MAGTIKGITIEIGGDTVGLQKALSDVNSKSRDLQSELKQVERALKFNPGNTELLAQKQQILTEQIFNTTEKLNRLKEAQQQVEQQFRNGDIGVDQYRAFQREIIQTESRLNGLHESLREMDDGSSVNDVRTDLQHLEEAAGNAEEGVKELGNQLIEMAAGAAAGAGLAEVIQKSLETSDLNTKIEISFDVPPESIQSVKSAVNAVSVYGVDAEEALAGVRKQWALNKDASDETNTAVVKGAAVIAASYADIDFNELIQNTNSVAKGLGISNEQALALQNSLLKTGFPPDQIDMIAEYGLQMKNAGFSVQQIQAIFEKGIDTKSWSLDNLLDGVKEARIQMASFGSGVDDATATMIKQTGISTKQFESWGQAVAAGGAQGSKAMSDVATWLSGIKDKTLQNQLATKVFGTMWEDQGPNMIAVLQGVGDATDKSKQNMDGLTNAASKLDSSPAVQLQTALTDMNAALQPVYIAIANMITKIAEWVSVNPELAATISAVASSIGILTGLLMALSVVAGALDIALLPLIGIIAAIVVAIGLLIAAGIVVWKNWDSISKWLSDTWNTISATAISVFSAIGSFFTSVWSSISSTAISVWTAITSFLSAVWTGITTTASTIWNGIVNVFTFVFLLIQSIIVGTWTVITSLLIAAWNIIVALTAPIWQPVAAFFVALWSGIQAISMAVWGGIQAFFLAVWSGIVAFAMAVFIPISGFFSSVWSAISSVSIAIWSGIIAFLSGIWSGIVSTGTAIFSALSVFLSGVWSGISSTASSIWSGISGVIVGIVNGISSTVSGIWNGIKSTTASVWGGIQSAIMTPINAAKDGVRSAIEAIKGFFSGLSLKLPDIKLPHFGLSGNFSLNPPSVPHLTVDWYKNGGVFPANSPRLVGMGDANVPEAALPLSDAVLGTIAGMIASHMQGGGNTYNFYPQKAIINQQDIVRELQRMEALYG